MLRKMREYSKEETQAMMAELEKLPKEVILAQLKQNLEYAVAKNQKPIAGDPFKIPHQEPGNIRLASGMEVPVVVYMDVMWRLTSLLKKEGNTYKVPFETRPFLSELMLACHNPAYRSTLYTNDYLSKKTFELTDYLTRHEFVSENTRHILKAALQGEKATLRFVDPLTHPSKAHDSDNNSSADNKKASPRKKS